MMGSGDEFFNAAKREDKKIVYSLYQKEGYQILKIRLWFAKSRKKGKKLLGAFSTGALPYSIDRNNITSELQGTPDASLKWLKLLYKPTERSQRRLWLLQVEGGKVRLGRPCQRCCSTYSWSAGFRRSFKSGNGLCRKEMANTLVIITTRSRKR